MKTIHIVLGKANPNRMNGVNKVVHQLVTEQINHGFDSEVWGIAENTEVNYDQRNFKTQLFKKSKNPFQAPRDLKAAISKLDSQSNALHFHGSWIPVFSSIAKLAMKLDIKMFVTPHGGYNTIAMKKNGFVKRQYFKWIEGPMLNRIDKIHVIGASEITGLKSIFPNQKQVLIPYGFKQENNIFKTESIEKEEFIVGFVGRIDIWTKGLDLLIEAFTKLPKNIKLWIIGDGAEMPELLKMIANKNLTDQVVVYGSRFGKDKDSLIAKMDTFVHPSRNEGLPSAVLEACNLGVPSIVSKETNVSQVIDAFQAGIEMTKNTAFELHRAILKMATAKRKGDLRNYSANAQRMIKEAFNWSNIIQAFNKMYYSV